MKSPHAAILTCFVCLAIISQAPNLLADDGPHEDTALAAYTARHAIVLRDDGFYILAPDSTALIKLSAGRVIDQRSGATPDDPQPPGGDPQPPGEDLTDRAKEISMLSSIVSDKKVGAALATVCRSLHDAGLKGDAAKQAFDTAFSMVLNTVVGSTPADWSQWKGQVAALGDEHGWDEDFLKDVGAGLADALGVAGEVDRAIDSAQYAQTVTGLEEGAQLDIGKIIALIIQILELLRDLGVLD